MGRKNIIPDLEEKIGQQLKPWLSTALRNNKTPEQISQELGIGKTKVYDLIRDFDLKSVQKEVRRSVKKGTENELRRLVEQYLEEKRVSGLSSETIKKDESMWGLWFWWLEYAGYPVNLQSMLDDSIIIKFFRYLETETIRFGRHARKPVGKSTIQTYSARMAAFVHWMQKKGIIGEEKKIDPFSRMMAVKIPKKLPEDIPEPILKMALNSFDESTFEGIRDKTIFSWFLETGQRLKGVANIKLSSFNWETGVGRVTEKGSKQRTIVLSEKLKAQVKKYLEVRAPRTSSNALWIGRKNKPLTDSGIWQMFHKLNEIPEIKEAIARLAPGQRFHPHLFRHLWAKYLVESEVPGFAMMVMGGWEDLELVQHYAAAYAQEKAWKYIDKSSPLANIE